MAQVKMRRARAVSGPLQEKDATRLVIEHYRTIGHELRPLHLSVSAFVSCDRLTEGRFGPFALKVSPLEERQQQQKALEQVPSPQAPWISSARLPDASGPHPPAPEPERGSTCHPLGRGYRSWI